MKLFNLFLIAFLTFSVNSFGQEKNKSPKIELLMIDGKKSPSIVPLNPGEKYLIKVSATDPEKDQLKAKWELFAKSELTIAAQNRRKPVALPDMVTGSFENVMLDVPVKQGAYKLILTVTDSSKNIATASIDLSVL
ncbi:MAG: hypothetical protein EOO89_09805 [Pedobacter sp.]|nr:MAG: hypothetical protein EOO89_09805 [Pedobacter sp.]